MMEQNRFKPLIMSNKPVKNGTDVAMLCIHRAAACCHIVNAMVFRVAMQLSLNAADSAQRVIQYRTMYHSGGNEIMFATPRNASELPAITHFK
jgi:hypothetical protein